MLARAENTTLAGAIEHSLDAAAEARFWAEVARTMGSGAVAGDVERGAVAGDAERGAQSYGALSDGLEVGEDWSNVW